MFKKHTSLEKFNVGKKTLLSHGGRIAETNETHGTISYKTVVGGIVVDYEFINGCATFHVVKLPFCLTEKQVERFVSTALE